MTRAERIEAAARRALDLVRGPQLVWVSDLREALALPPDPDNGRALALSLLSDNLAELESVLQDHYDLPPEGRHDWIGSAIGLVRAARQQVARLS